MAETYQELQKFSEDELIQLHNRQTKGTEFLDDYYLRVLNWRLQERQTNQIKWMTVFITALTVVVTVATVVNVVIAV